MKNKKIFFYLLLSQVFFIFSSCGNSVSEKEDAKNKFCIPDSMVKNITVDTVKSESVMSDLKLSGKITVNEDNIVKVFPLAGGHVAEVKVSLGDFVQQGQTLAVINSSDIANYFNEYTAAKSELDITKKNLEVTEDMNKNGLGSEKELIDAQEDYTKALSAYNKASEVLRIFGNATKEDAISGSEYLIKSPITGFIVDKNINTGMELRTDDANNLFTISDLKEVWAVANVYETDISKIKTGSDVLISTLSYPDKKFSGKVERISNILNPETNVMTVKIRLANEDYSLKPGMFANISILFPETEKMLVVSSKSIVFDENKNYVVHFKNRCDMEMQQVKVVKSFNDISYIQNESLHKGDLVISRNELFVFSELKKH